MAARTPPNTMKVKIWTDNISADFSGNISACVIEGFSYIMPGTKKTAAENRELAPKLMTERHEKLVAAGR